MNKILIVEDDMSLGQGLVIHIKSEGYIPLLARSLAEAKNIIAKDRPALIILDWMLPDGQGVDLLKELRKEQVSTPIIMLTARVDLIDKIIGLESGANDYLTKPFEPRELIARIRVQLRDKSVTSNSIEMAKNNIITLGKIELNISGREINYHGRAVDLTKMEFDLLRLFLESPGKVFPREEILNKVWGYENYPTTRTVDTHILQIRQKFPDLDIETVRGIGYRLKK